MATPLDQNVSRETLAELVEASAKLNRGLLKLWGKATMGPRLDLVECLKCADELIRFVCANYDYDGGVDTKALWKALHHLGYAASKVSGRSRQSLIRQDVSDLNFFIDSLDESSDAYIGELSNREIRFVRRAVHCARLALDRLEARLVGK
jgi:hypothetical protein